MHSPFPGMDPFLEGEFWQEFHERLANQISSILLGGPVPAGHYYVYLTRASSRLSSSVWAIPLAQSLPTVPVPLLHPDADVALNIQDAVDACFALVGYERLLDYHAPLPPPELTAPEQIWLDACLRAWRSRVNI